jgi:hypothetical protein
MRSDRIVLDLGSQDLDLEFLKAFKRKLKESSHPAGRSGNEELIMFTAGGRPYQFKDLEELITSIGKLPEDVGYFYYTLLLGGLRASLYLDPDRPAKLVLDGPKDATSKMGSVLRRSFPPSGPRDVIHGRFGPFIVWGTVLAMAVVFLSAVILATREVRPLLVSWVILISGMVGAYLSIARSRAFAMASTMSLGKKRRPYLDLVLHFITVALGIISVIIVAMLL